MKMDLPGKNVLVVGMAKSGLAAVELLLEHGAKPRAVDSNPTAEMRAHLDALDVSLEPQSPEAFTGVDLIVLSPGVPLDEVPEGATPVIGEVELAAYFLRGPIIGITGSNGKTTTTALIGHILKESGIPCQVGGNIGTPPTAMVGTSDRQQWNVLELSSFQLETIQRFHATIGVCMNVTQNHLDRHKTFENYAAAKARLFDTLGEHGHAVLNYEDATCIAYSRKVKGNVCWFSSRGKTPGGFWLDGESIVSSGRTLMNRSEIPLRGLHNVENVMAAACACEIAGASFEQIRKAVRTFPGIEHRIEFVRKLEGVDYYNDSKATSVDATLKAVDAFDSGLWIILGGKDKGSDYRPLRAPLETKAKAALLIGAAAPKIAEHLEGAVPLIACGDIRVAVETASSKATTGDTVLLAPACASFDQFQSYEHRGRVFKDLVNGLRYKE